LPVTEFHDPDIIALPDLLPGAEGDGLYRLYGLGVLKAVMVLSARSLFIVVDAWGIFITAFLFSRCIGAVIGRVRCCCQEQRRDTG
jgi:hypothetical protein